MGSTAALRDYSVKASHGNNKVFTGNTKATGLLERFAPEENSGTKKNLHVRQSPMIRKLEAEFEKLLRVDTNSHEKAWLARGLAGKIECSAADIAQFSLELAKYQYDREYTYDKAGCLSAMRGFFYKASLFLSAIMNDSPENDFIVPTGHLDVSLRSFGYLNTKNIWVSGDLGEETGNMMKAGKLVVEGNCRGYTGHKMEGGLLEVIGSIGECGAYSMLGGKLIVRGDAGESLGLNMKGGEMHIMGRIESLFAKDSEEGGDIYQRGRQIVKGGKKIAEIINE